MTTTPDAATPPRPASPWRVAVAVVIPTFMEVLDTTIANVALRYIAGGLSSPVGDSEWVITSYLAANAIILPISGPGLAATAILCFLYSWNDFFFALILTRTEAMTAPVAVVNFMNYEGWEWGKIAAGGTMVMLPVLVFSILVRKFLIHGMTAGAVKG